LLKDWIRFPTMTVFLFSPAHLDTFWDPTSFVYNGYQNFFAWLYRQSENMKFTSM
jgi:hypothetical protein